MITKEKIKLSVSLVTGIFKTQSFTDLVAIFDKVLDDEMILSFLKQAIEQKEGD